MMDVFESHDTIVIQTHADPRIAALVGALTDCIHPRAARLKARLAADPDDEQLGQLRAEVLNLVAMSFGLAEAERRLQAVQYPATGLPAW